MTKRQILNAEDFPKYHNFPPESEKRKYVYLDNFRISLLSFLSHFIS